MGFKIDPASKLRKLLENYAACVDIIAGNQQIINNRPNETETSLLLPLKALSRLLVNHRDRLKRFFQLFYVV